MAVGLDRYVTYRGAVRGADRWRSSGLWAGGLRCCLAIVAALGLWLGTAAAGQHLDQHLAVSGIHQVAVATTILRPAPGTEPAVPTELVLLAVALTGVLAWSRPTAVGARSHPDRPRGRAPPSHLLHH